MSTCAICGRGFKVKPTGRPRKFCSDRCKEKDKRKRGRDADRASLAGVRGLFQEGDFETDGVAVSGSGPQGLCHVCSQRAATVGTPEPLLCQGCATSIEV